MSKPLACLLVLGAAVGWAAADEAVVAWRTADGTAVMETRITLPIPITREHIDTLGFRTTAGAPAGEKGPRSPFRTWENLAPDLRAFEPAPLREAPPGTGQTAPASPDWSGGVVTITALQVSSCYLTIGSFSGLLLSGQSFVVTVQGAMSVVAAVDPLKGDPDLYLVDAYGYDICASTNLGKAADSCAALETSCRNGDLFVEVYGVKKKNIFTLGVWLTAAV